MRTAGSAPGTAAPRGAAPSMPSPRPGSQSTRQGVVPGEATLPRRGRLADDPTLGSPLNSEPGPRGRWGGRRRGAPHRAHRILPARRGGAGRTAPLSQGTLRRRGRRRAPEPCPHRPQRPSAVAAGPPGAPPGAVEADAVVDDVQSHGVARVGEADQPGPPGRARTLASATGGSAAGRPGGRRQEPGTLSSMCGGADAGLPHPVEHARSASPRPSPPARPGSSLNDPAGVDEALLRELLDLRERLGSSLGRPTARRGRSSRSRRLCATVSWISHRRCVEPTPVSRCVRASSS